MKVFYRPVSNISTVCRKKRRNFLNFFIGPTTPRSQSFSRKQSKRDKSCQRDSIESSRLFHQKSFHIFVSESSFFPLVHSSKLFVFSVVDVISCAQVVQSLPTIDWSTRVGLWCIERTSFSSFFFQQIN